GGVRVPAGAEVRAGRGGGVLCMLAAAGDGAAVGGGQPHVAAAAAAWGLRAAARQRAAGWRRGDLAGAADAGAVVGTGRGGALRRPVLRRYHCLQCLAFVRRRPFPRVPRALSVPAWTDVGSAAALGDETAMTWRAQAEWIHSRRP